MGLVKEIARNRRVGATLKSFEENLSTILDEAIAIQQIPAPTFSESERAAYIERRFLEVGLQDVGQDAIHNVFGKWPGTGSVDPVVISAHSDTVFPADTDLSVRFENGNKPGKKIVYGPGLADNALGVAGLVSIAQVLIESNLTTDADIWFVANVCEEGLGDLRGMRSVVDRFGPMATYIIVEGGSFGHIFHQAIGVRRFRLAVRTPGGHSWGDYGMPSAVHQLGRIITFLDDLSLPSEPKTTLNVGVVEGGTTVNTIAASASCLLDLRSMDSQALEELVEAVNGILESIENSPEVTISLSQIGNRPAGFIPRDKQLVVWAAEALNQMGCSRVEYMAGSTDANVPISQGLAAVCIGLARSANTHRLDEYLDPTDLPKGLGQLLLLTLAAAGFEDNQPT
jgi:acetylornithine deacetylase/succinyl-diaminopimelate desuccinylase-like protein